MKLILKKNVHMDIDDDGVLSIEASLVLPIYILLLIVFVYLINTVTFNNKILSSITKDLMEYKKETFESFVNNKNTFLRASDVELDKRVYDYKKYVYENNNDLITHYYFTYKMPLIYIQDVKVNKDIISKKFYSGKSITGYGLVSEYIKSDYDVWLLSNINRGKNINTLLEGSDSFDGTSIDKIYNGYLISIVSLDFRKESYNNDYAVLDKIKSDANRLNDFKEGYVNKNYISKSDYNGKMLNIVIPASNFNSSIEKQLSIAKTYCNNKNIQFKITVVE